MSTAASRAKYLYNKKYQDAYWERRAKREGLSGDETDKPKSSKKVADEVQLLQTLKLVLLGDLGEPTKCCINRDEYIGKDEIYIKALENSNRIMGSENRRLINLLTQYQKIIGIGVDNIYHELKMKGGAV